MDTTLTPDLAEKLRHSADECLRQPESDSAFERILSVVAKIDPDHADHLRLTRKRHGGLSTELTLEAIIELFSQRSAIVFATNVVSRCIDQSGSEYDGPREMLNRVREWLAGRLTKKAVLAETQQFAEELTELEGSYHRSFEDHADQAAADKAAERLCIYSAALAIADATQPYPRKRHSQICRYWEWSTWIANALYESMEAKTCNVRRSSARKRKIVEAEHSHRIVELRAMLSHAKWTERGFVAAE